MDRLFVVCENEDTAKSVTGKMEWVSSFGSIFRFDVFSKGLYPRQGHKLKITAS
jgi:hypothetical protein